MSSSAITGPILSDVRRSPSGSAAAPSWSFADATGTGVYLASTDVLALSTAGVQRVVVDAAGNVGVGVTPASWVSTFRAQQIGSRSAIYQDSSSATAVANNIYNDGTNKYIASAASTVYLQEAGSHKWFTAPSGTAGNPITFNQAMTLDSSGALRINNNGGFSEMYFGSTSGSGAAAISVDVANNAMRCYTAGSERMRIDGSGNLLVGATNATTYATTPGVYLLGGSASGYFLNNSTTNAGTSLILCYSSVSVANQTKFEVTASGDVRSRTGVYGGFSDERLKQNVTPASSQWNDIKNIEVVKFQFKSEQFSDDENPWMLGTIAQQVEKVSPGLVDEDQKDGMKAVKYSILYMKAIKALQEAMERIEKLEARLAALESKP